jgi:hypothetical protein
MCDCGLARKVLAKNLHGQGLISLHDNAFLLLGSDQPLSNSRANLPNGFLFLQKKFYQILAIMSDCRITPQRGSVAGSKEQRPSSLVSMFSSNGIHEIRTSNSD